jgi:hypothetical protein
MLSFTYWADGRQARADIGAQKVSCKWSLLTILH